MEFIFSEHRSKPGCSGNGSNIGYSDLLLL